MNKLFRRNYYMKSIKIVMQEQIRNLYMIGRLSGYELKKSYAGNLLGSFGLS